MSWSSWGWGVLESVANTTGQIVSDLADAIDVPDDEQTPNQPKPTDQSSDQPETQESKQLAEGEVASTPDESANKPKVAEEPKPPKPTTTEFNSPLLSLFVGNGNQTESTDSVYSFFSSGAEYLSGQLQKGVDTLQNSEVDMSKFREVLNPITDVGFGALESIGAAAMSVLTVEEGTKDKPKTKPIWIPIIEAAEELTNEKTESIPTTENTQGKSHMENLEQYSFECMSQTQKVYHKLDLEKRDSMDEIIGSVQDLFDEEKNEDETVVAPKTELNAALDEMWRKLEDSFQKPKEIVKTQLAEFDTELTAKKESTNVQLNELANDTLDKLQTECIKSLSVLTSDCVQQFEAIALFLINDPKIDQSQALEKAQYICGVEKYFDQELTGVSGVFVSAMESVVSSIEPAMNDTTENVELKATLKKKVAALKNKVYVSVSNGISNVEEAKKFLLPVCKFIIVGKEISSPTPANIELIELETPSKSKEDEIVKETTEEKKD